MPSPLVFPSSLEIDPISFRNHHVDSVDDGLKIHAKRSTTTMTPPPLKKLLTSGKRRKK